MAETVTSPQPEWMYRQAHHDAAQLVWEGPAHRGRVWNQECRDALAVSGHTALGYDDCACRRSGFMIRSVRLDGCPGCLECDPEESGA